MIPNRIEMHYHVVRKPNGQFFYVKCNYCGEEYECVDVSGRRNWFAAINHAAMHVRQMARVTAP